MRGRPRRGRSRRERIRHVNQGRVRRRVRKRPRTVIKVYTPFFFGFLRVSYSKLSFAPLRPNAKKNQVSPPRSSDLTDVPACVGQKSLDQGNLLFANLALTTQALLVARGHVGVQVLLPGTSVENLLFGGDEKESQEVGGESRSAAACRARVSVVHRSEA